MKVHFTEAEIKKDTVFKVRCVRMKIPMQTAHCTRVSDIICDPSRRNGHVGGMTPN